MSPTEGGDRPGCRVAGTPERTDAEPDEARNISPTTGPVQCHLSRDSTEPAQFGASNLSNFIVRESMTLHSFYVRSIDSFRYPGRVPGVGNEQDRQFRGIYW